MLRLRSLFRPSGFILRNYHRARPQALPVNTVVKFVPQQEAWIVERFGRFNRVLEPGFTVLLPFVDRVRYVKTLKEVAVLVPSQSAITQDNVTIVLDGVLYYRILDPYKASYGIEDADFAITQLAQTTMRSEIGKLTLDRTLAERTELNAHIVAAINDAAAHWGIQCLRYEIRDIQPPESVVKSMHSQVSADRQKRALILESEGERQSAINKAEGQKQATILASEADRLEKINQAEGQAEAILRRAQATARSIEAVASSLKGPEAASGAVSLMIAEKYMEAFAALAKEGNTLLLPTGMSEPASVISQAMSLYKTIQKQP